MLRWLFSVLPTMFSTYFLQTSPLPAVSSPCHYACPTSESTQKSRPHNFSAYTFVSYYMKAINNTGTAHQLQLFQYPTCVRCDWLFQYICVMYDWLYQPLSCVFFNLLHITTACYRNMVFSVAVWTAHPWACDFSYWFFFFSIWTS